MATDPWIPGLTGVVTRNGEEVDFSEVTFRRTSDHLTPGWSITFPQPLLIEATDTWTIKLGFAGSERTLINEALARNISAEDGVKSYARSVSGEGDSNPEAANVSALTEYGIPKTYVFVRSDWLTETIPWAKMKDGILQGQNEDHTWFRIMDPRLPKQEIKATEFEVFLGMWTHQSIARFLADKVGFTLITNLPDIPVIDTHTIPVGTNWFSAIKQDLEIWKPFIQVEASGDSKLILVIDAVADEADLPGLQKIRLTNTAISSTSLSEEIPSQKVDHVIVTGRATPNSLITWPEDSEDDIIEIPEVTYTPNKTKTYKQSLDASKIAQWKQFTWYTGTFGEDEDEFTPYGVKYVMHTEKSYVDKTKRLNLLIEEIDETTRQDGKVCHRLAKYFRFGEGGKPIGSLEIESGLVRWPGQSSELWKTIKAHHILQNQFHTGIKKALTSETTEEVVLYTLTTESKKTAPIPLSRYLKVDFDRTAIDKDTDTTQKIEYLATRHRWNKVDRRSDDTLEQKIFDWDVLAGTWNVQRQSFQNPMQAEKKNEESTTYRHEVHDGNGVTIGGVSGCYHPPAQVNHEDIDNDATSEALADRIFAAANDKKINVTVKTPVPIPIDTLAVKIGLPSLTYYIDDVSTTVPAADYLLKSIEIRLSYSGTKNEHKLNHEMTLGVWTTQEAA